MKNLVGKCLMCKDPLLVITESITGRKRPLCPKCEEFVNKKTRQGRSKRGERVSNKEIIFPSVE